MAHIPHVSTRKRARNEAQLAARALRDPLGDFSAVQWYCYQARQTVYFTAFSTIAYTETDLLELARKLMVFAPQLTTGFVGSKPGHIPADAVLAQLVDVQAVDDLNAYPDAWSATAAPFIERPDLPLFRVRAAVCAGGTDGAGRVACIQVLSTHALMEGVDSALLTRSQISTHDDVADLPVPRQPLVQMLSTAFYAWSVAPIQLAIAAMIAPREVDFGQRMVTVDRKRLRRVAMALGVRQRSLLFALVAHALNDGGRGFSRRALQCTYVDLDSANVPIRGDGFFRFRLMEGTFRVRDDMAAFARGVDAEIGRIEARDVTVTQRRMSALFGVHRKLRRWLPFLYSDRIFRFTGFFHMNLSLVPPHRLSGPLAAGLMEPIYCGSYHEGMNVCVFAPGRQEVTLSFNMQLRHVQQVGKILPLLDALEAELVPGDV